MIIYSVKVTKTLSASDQALVPAGWLQNYLKWLKTVSSTFQGLDFNMSL